MIVSTTGSNVTINAILGSDNLPYVLVHPQVDFNMLSLFSEEDLEAAQAEIQAAIVGGTLTVKDQDGNVVTNAAQAVSNNEHTHDEYTTTAEATALAAAGAGVVLAAHTSNSDPHSQYTTPAEAAASAPVQTVNTQSGVVQLTTDDVPEGTKIYSPLIPTTHGYTMPTTQNWGIGGEPDAICQLYMVDETGKDVCIEQVGTAGSAFMDMRKARGTIAAKTALLDGDKIAGFDASAYNGTSYNSVTEIGSFVTEDHTTSASGAEMRLGSTENGTTTRVDRLIVEHDGDIKLPKYDSSRNDGKAPHNRIAYVEADGTIQVGEARSSFISNSGRFQFSTSNPWITESDDNYGPSYYPRAESAGTGSNPTVEWEHMGTILPAGVFIKNLHLTGRVNSTQITDMDISIRARVPNPLNRYQSGIDSDGEMTNTEIFRGFWKAQVGSFSGSMNDMHAATISIDHLLTELTQISIYVKPSGSLSSTRYFYSTWSWEIV